jgi:hypothetical protein
MAFDEHLAERIDQVLKEKNIVFISKKMMGGLCYMVDDKMLCGIIKGNFMARIGEDFYPEALKIEGCIEMDFSKRPMKGYVYVEPDGIDLDSQLEFWVQKTLDFNPLAKSSKKKK